MRTPHDPETGEVLEGEGAAKPPSRQTAAQAAVAQQNLMRGKIRGTTDAGAAEPPPTTPDNLHGALRGMQDARFLKSQKHQEQHWRAVREGAHPDILEFEKRMRRRLAKLGVPVFAHCVVRSIEQQAIEFAQGDSKVKFGPHNVGCAIDLIHATRGWKLTRPQWQLIGHVGQEIVTQAGLDIVSLAWGGDWKFYDPAHWEITDWQSVQASYPWPPALR